MRLKLLCDAHWESRVDVVLRQLPSTRDFFESRDYGSDLTEIDVVFMCRQLVPFARRKSLNNELRRLEMDVMLDFDAMKSSSMPVRKTIMLECLVSGLSEVLASLKPLNFDEGRFLSDLRGWFANGNPK